MRFTVTWDKPVQNDLADIWNRATDRAAVTSASNQFDVDLRDDPIGKSEDRGAYRCMKVHPLLILFEVDPGDCKVRVVHVQRYP